MTRKSRLALWWLFPLLMLLTASGRASYPKEYWAEPIAAQVVDADSGEPLEGVVVVADWELNGGAELSRVGDLMILETVTDREGRFSFPGWGPVAVPYEHPDVPPNTRLTDGDPMLIFFKSGYGARVVFNALSMDALKGKGGPVRHSDWNGMAIKLPKFQGTLADYADHLSRLDDSLDSIFLHATLPCTPDRMPRLLQALRAQRAALERAGLFGTINSFEDYMDDRSCGQGRAGP